MDDWVSGNAVVCKGIPGLTKEQVELCHRNPDVTVAAIKGLQVAVSECQHQFMWHRWNCSSLTPSSRTQQSSVLLKRGKRQFKWARTRGKKSRRKVDMRRDAGERRSATLNRNTVCALVEARSENLSQIHGREQQKRRDETRREKIALSAVLFQCDI